MNKEPQQNVHRTSLMTDRLIAVIFLAVLFLFAIGTVFNFFGIYREYVGEFSGLNNLVQALTFRGGQETAVVPKETDNSDVSENETVPVRRSLLDRTVQFCESKSRFFKKITFNLEDMYTRYFYKLEWFVDSHGLFSRLMGKSVLFQSFDKGFYRSSHHYLFDVGMTPIVEAVQTFEPTEDDYSRIEKLASINQDLKREGVRFLFVYPGIKGYPDSEQMLNGQKFEQTFEYQREKWYIDELEARGVPTLWSMRELENIRFPVDERFYRTDHHWTHQAGFALLPKMLEKLDLISKEESENTKVEDYFNPIKKNAFFVGSTGRNTGAFFCRPDDFTYYMPKEEARYTVDYIHRVTHEKRQETGTFSDVIVSSKNLDPSDRYANRYGYCLGGVDLPAQWVRNESISNNRKVLVVKTSHAAPFIAFLTCFLKEEIILDFRHLRPDEGGLLDFVERDKPDTVVVIAPSHSIDAIH